MASIHGTVATGVGNSAYTASKHGVIGLVRVAAGSGTAIEVEVWALPAAGFGTFVASIPAPLSIGTLRLGDGTTPKGFLAEPEGLVGAAEIGAHGGWRGYLGSLGGR